MKFKIPDTPEELFRQGGQNLSRVQGWVPFFFLIFVILGIIVTSFYTVEQDEAGVVRRFGKFIRTTEPGLHWKIPFNIDTAVKVPITRVLKQEFGFRTSQADVQTKYSASSYDEEALMLTGDLNVLDVSWIVQFKIKDPAQFLFNVSDPIDNVRDLSEAAMRQVIGDHSVTEALTTRKNEINFNVKEIMQNKLDKYDAGILITKVELQEVLPPDAVKASFNEVNEAEQEREKLINQAWENYNKIIPKARGEAEQSIREAEGYALARVTRAEGDATKFLETWNAYKNSKDVTRRRLYLETLEEIIPQVGKIYLFEPGANNILPLLKLNEDVK